MPELSDIQPREFHQLERTTGSFRGVLTDHLGDPIPGSVLDTLTLTLYDTDSAQTILNGRNDQDVLNTNGVTVDEDGNLVWEIAALDNIINRSALTFERHVALFEWTWANGERFGKHEAIVVVRNLSKVP